MLVIIFVVAAILTPPDPVTQIGLAMLDQANFIVEYSLYYGKDSLIMEFIDRYQSIWQSPTTAPSTDTAKSQPQIAQINVR